jgi:hypothetical protein
MRRLSYLCLFWLLTGASLSQGRTLFKLTFDEAGDGEGRAGVLYKASGRDVLPRGLDIMRVPGKESPGTAPAIRSSDGFQGGRALVLNPSPGNRHQGYYVPRDLPQVLGTPPSGAFDKVNGLTLEAIVFIERFEPGAGNILNQWGSGGMQPGLGLEGTVRGAPQIRFNIAGISLTSAPGSGFLGRWHHIAGVLTTVDKRCTVEIFLDGRSLGRKDAPSEDTTHASLFVPYRGFAIGVDALAVEQPSRPSQTITGKIDAVAVTLEALDPETFVLPSGPVKAGR